MASADILSQTLSSITSIKLDEISDQRSNFEDGKAKLLKSVKDEPDQTQRVRLLVEGIEELSATGKLKDNPVISLKNVKQFLDQARCDPSVSLKLQEDWQLKLEKEVDIHSLKYEYASLYGRLVNEWLSVSEAKSDEGSTDSSFEKVGRKEMHDQRKKWEDLVFKPCDTDTIAIQAYLEKLFKSTKSTSAAYEVLTKATEYFEKDMASTKDHFDDESLEWVIGGLLRSDLVTDEKRKVLKDFLNNNVVLAEVADVLNMRISSLQKWKWDPKGTPVEQRRQLNGRYRFYGDEDLLQSMLLRYVGVKWSVHFKSALTDFQQTLGVWFSSAALPSALDRKRREFFLGESKFDGVEGMRNSHFQGEVFLEQLAEQIDEVRGGYADDSEGEKDTRKSGAQITQSLLHTLATEVFVKYTLEENLTVVRTDFAWFGPSLPHSTMFAVLEFFGVSDNWIGFFRRALEAPMNFVDDGPDAPLQTRKRGTPISGPLSDMLGETVLFCLDFAFNHGTNGARMYRLHDDIWFWGAENACVEGWDVMTKYAKLFGLTFNQEKTGSVQISLDGKATVQASKFLPIGDVRWGFLKLDSATGRFLIDQPSVDTHIEELRLQLGACKSTFDWIQAWNVYGARFFTTNFGKPANCFGRQHVDMLLETFSRIQSKLFASTGGSVTSTLKQMLTDRFGVENIPEGYLYFPVSMGGLDLKSPFVNLYLVRGKISTRTREQVKKQLQTGFETQYAEANLAFTEGRVHRRYVTNYEAKYDFSGEPFMSFEEYSKNPERTSCNLAECYELLMREPLQDEVTLTSDVQAQFATQAVSFPAPPAASKRGYRVSKKTAKKTGWNALNPYTRWMVQLYAPDMIERFGGLNVVEKGLLPTGMVTMFRESRFKWQG